MLCPADVWIYYGVPLDIAEIFKSNRRMARSPACRIFYTYVDGMSAMQAWETVKAVLLS